MNLIFVHFLHPPGPIAMISAVFLNPALLIPPQPPPPPPPPPAPPSPPQPQPNTLSQTAELAMMMAAMEISGEGLNVQVIFY